jgi:hypothetical protein
MSRIKGGIGIETSKGMEISSKQVNESSKEKEGGN